MCDVVVVGLTEMDSPVLPTHIGRSSCDEKVCFFCLEGNPALDDYSDMFPCECKVEVHKECMGEWLDHHYACPICKQEVAVSPNAVSGLDPREMVRVQYELTRRRNVQDGFAYTTGLSICEKLCMLSLILGIFLFFFYPRIHGDVTD